MLRSAPSRQPDNVPAPPAARLRRIGSLWRRLHGPWPLLFSALLGFLLLLAAWLLPQLPGQLNDEPATASRWLAATAAGYGVWGGIYQTLGLFNVVHSPLFAALLAMITVVAAVHLARELARLRQFMRLATSLTRPAGEPGDPLALSPGEPVARWRGVLPAPPADVIDYLRAHLAAHYVLQQPQVSAPPAPALATNGAALAPAPEQRLLALRHARAVYLTPLLPLGLLLIVAAIWLALVFGWQVTTPALAPGDAYRSVNQGLTVRHPAPSGAAPPVAEITFGGVTRQISNAAGVTRFGLGDASITVRRTVPALWLSGGEGTALLAQPDSTPVAALGLVFPTPGSEESVLLPGEVAGLRLVRRTDRTDAFMVELYRSADVQPSLRVEVNAPEPVTIPLNDGRTLQATPTRALQVDVRYLPGLWIAWLGVAAILAGAAGAWLRPAYLLLQIAPWPGAAALLVAQAASRADLEALAAGLKRSLETSHAETKPAETAAMSTP
ncbi:MAG: hypothetical protein IT329_12635 [Caldilineaceae bacterium]|nr:hypothetical protein [Caldilineaceae bacterium]